jgi:hypothetical protein
VQTRKLFGCSRKPSGRWRYQRGLIGGQGSTRDALTRQTLSRQPKARGHPELATTKTTHTTKTTTNKSTSGISQNKLARDLDVPVGRINDIIYPCSAWDQRRHPIASVSLLSDHG